jgi:hypothetical protein
MDFALVYLLQRFFYRIFEFFHHWYINGSRAIGRGFMGALTSADHSLALKITLRHFFDPLYGDYSVIGRILGIIFRSGRIAIGTVVYVILAAVFLLIYLVWIAIPFIIFYYAAKTF